MVNGHKEVILMKKIAITISALCLLIITGCTNKEEVAQELIDYHNGYWIAVQEMKVLGIDALNEQVFPEEGTLDEISEFDIEEGLSTMNKITNYLEAIEPTHEDIQELHELLKDAEEFSFDALQDQIAYANGNDNEHKIKKNNEKLVKKFDTFVEYRNELMEKYKVDWGDETDITGVKLMESK